MTKKSRLPADTSFPGLIPQPKPETQAKPAPRPKVSRPSTPDADQNGRDKMLMGVRLHPDDIARLKHFAIDQHSTVSEIISKWIERYAK